MGGPRRSATIGEGPQGGVTGSNTTSSKSCCGRCGVLGGAELAAAAEAILVGTGLLFARSLAGPSPRALMLALWGFLLVQSVHFLIGGVRLRAASNRGRDPFEVAYARAAALLDGELR